MNAMKHPPKVKQAPKPPKPCLAAVAIAHPDQPPQADLHLLRWQVLGHFPSRGAAKRAVAAYIADHEHVLYLVLNQREKGEYALYDRLTALIS